MKFTYSAKPASSVPSQCLVLFTTSTEKGPQLELKDKDLQFAQTLFKKISEAKKFAAKSKELFLVREINQSEFENLLFVGLGEKSKVNEESLRAAAALIAKGLAKEKYTSVTIALETCRKLTRVAEHAGRALAEGIGLASYKYVELKSKQEEKKTDKKETKETSLFFALADKSALKKFESGAEAGRILSECTNFARDLGNSPGNYLTATRFAERAKEASKGLPIKFQALNKKQIEALKMGAFLGVNQGSHEEPRFIIMEYFGAAKSKKPVILVGKGLTFDTGGISLKPGPGMEDMKFDMCGGAAVVGAVLALAKLKAKVNVVGLVPSTDNMPGGNSIKPGDVLTARNGKTIEVNNTDAEGRLILSDALCYACDHYEPEAIFDAATLTGACVVALGNLFAGYFCKDEQLNKKIQDAAKISGERIWQLPLVDEIVEDMKGTYADLSNIGPAGKAGSSQGAAFLSEFVKPEIPWAHFDIAGVAYNTGGRHPANPDKGASGFAVRLFADLTQQFFKG